MPAPADRLEYLRARLDAFATERDWDQFHNPKNLAMALAGEVGELLEHFQWLTLEEAASLPPATRRRAAVSDTARRQTRHRPCSLCRREARPQCAEIPRGKIARCGDKV
jgi:NTP pyrophosphatase (non-canonical NTP hydrolase)